MLQLLYGIYLSLSSFIVFRTVLNNTKSIKKYGQMVSINIFFLSFLDLCISFVGNTLYNLTNNTYFSFIYYLYYITTCIIHGLVFLFCYTWSLDQLGGLLNMNLKSIDKHYRNINMKMYFFFVGLTFYIFSSLIYYIPYLGPYLGFIYSTYSYSYFCLEYSLQYMEQDNLSKINIFEGNPSFFFGLGLVYSILANYYSQIHFFTIFIILFPLTIIRFSKTYKIKPNDNNKSYLLYLPVVILDYLLDYIHTNISARYKIQDEKKE